MAKLLAFFGFGIGLVCCGIGGYQMTEPWRQPSIHRVQFEFQLLESFAANQEYTVPMVIRNDNQSEISICGEFTC